MIRRGFWLLAGAVLGVSGYRRARRLAGVFPIAHTRALVGPSAGPQAGRLAELAPGGRAMPGPAAVPRQPGRGNPGGGNPGSRTAGSGGPGALARILSAAGFVRDVRDGMTEYWDLHRRE
ncbi:MAG TPA: hypothetical protein VGI58_12960 [Streptosporangiaceae bacterium]